MLQYDFRNKLENLFCACIRVHRDGITPQVVFDLVTTSNGYDARNFFG
jgi:hypothetical protein